MEKIKNTDLIIERANTFKQRLLGLMFRKEPPQGKGLLIEPCRSIHMFFMRFAIDVVVLDQNQNIIALYESLQPRKVTPYLKDAVCFIEFEEGTISSQGFRVGQSIEIVHDD